MEIKLNRRSPGLWSSGGRPRIAQVLNITMINDNTIIFFIVHVHPHDNIISYYYEQ